MLENLNDALTGIVQLDFRILDLNAGLIQTRISDTLCHFLGKIILNNLRAYNLENPYNSLMKMANLCNTFENLQASKNFHKVQLGSQILSFVLL